MDSTWAPMFLSDFRPAGMSVRGRALGGWVSTVSMTPDYPNGAAHAYHATLYDEAVHRYGDTARADDNNPTTYTRNDIGAWFVRDAAPVPAPTTLTLLGLGLISLGINRRKRGAKV
ncbi:PEP-CTERM sorting domain-containing protein [Halieaceae bacterium IMCC14734]|uniref:PEP-CTERM sorting domain-containing protein n=1 Tax=Candidatus Litorirhabdus singularis TaxID=2518993 RepID=A0ABT3TCA0_9GAMM|nr:PEP-CTERM sorting domain-containing protein [Candidatus Litorirhabdus singularis]